MAYTTINKGSSYFNTVLYTGTGSGGSNRQITGVGFQPDWVWVKTRGSIQEHVLSDVVRGATGALDSSATTAEEITNTRIGAFISDGFQLGSGAVQNRVNENGVGLVAWNWLANGAGVSNTSGTITSTVSANTTSGFSIVSYTGNGSSSATVGHGLGVAPKMIILKRRNASDTWYVMNTSLTSNNNVFLNLTDAQENVSTYTAGLISTSPTSSVFSFVNGSTVNNVNASGGTYIAYCFAEIKGYSKFGSYTGNGSNDGTFIYTGFKPAFVLWKVSSTVEGWYLVDNKRDTYNASGNYILPNTSATESGANSILDLLSNGFKFRSSGGAWWNGSGSTYIYMAFAENPFTSSKGIPCTAR